MKWSNQAVIKIKSRDQHYNQPYIKDQGENYTKLSHSTDDQRIIVIKLLLYKL